MAGADCYGIARLIYSDRVGIDLPDFLGTYDDADDTVQVQAAIENAIPDFTEVDTPDPFDIIILRLMGHPIHCSLYVGEGKMLHTMKGHMSAIEPMNSVKWKSRIEGIYRWKK